MTTRCRQGARLTGRPYAKLCDGCRGWRKVVWTACMDEELQRVYARGDYRHNGSLGALAARWKIPCWKVTHQAQRLPSEKPPQQVASEGEWFIRP